MEEETSPHRAPSSSPTKTSPSPSSSIKITDRTERTLITHIFHRIFRPIGPFLITASENFGAESPKLTAPSKIKKKWTVQERQVENIWMYDLLHKPTTKKCHHRIYYFAGGGWQSPPSSHHWKFLSALASELPETVITVVSYPLAPEAPLPISFPLLIKWYTAIMRQSVEDQEKVTLMGDSAGGNIVLALVLSALEQGAPLPPPYSIFAICPSVDLKRSNPDIKMIEKLDPVLRLKSVNETAQAWLGVGKDDVEAFDAEDPRASPLFADISVLRKGNVIVDGTIGGYDILGPDGRLFVDKLKKEGVTGDWLLWDKMMHCWPLAVTYGLFRESGESFDWIVKVLKKRSQDASEVAK